MKLSWQYRLRISRYGRTRVTSTIRGCAATMVPCCSCDNGIGSSFRWCTLETERTRAGVAQSPGDLNPFVSASMSPLLYTTARTAPSGGALMTHTWFCRLALFHTRSVATVLAK